MGVYFNPNNESFTKDRNYKIYIDKTGLLEYLNEALGTPKYNGSVVKTKI